MESELGDVAQISGELANVVEIMMSPNVSQQQRLDVYNALERFKETSQLCAQCGLYLVQKYPNRSSVIRHFGLQLMEHCVKYRWTQMSQSEKIFIKENAMNLLREGTDPYTQDESHIKDVLSRIIVEMIKREWPQQWPTMLAELREAYTRGESQTEVVLLVFLRLVEDVVLLQTLESNQRRKDISQALTANMAEIFLFFRTLLEDHCSAFQKHIALGNTTEAATHSKLVQVVLLTLTSYVEWVSITHIMADKGRLLQILCVFLSDRTFQCAAVECLLQIVNRRGKMEDRKQLIFLFTEDALRCIYTAAVVQETHAAAHEFDESHYLFLKKLTQVLTDMASHLCAVWGKDGRSIVHPERFNAFLDIVLSFSSHQSLALSHIASGIWMMLFRHEQIKTDPCLLAYVPKFIESAGPKLIKVAYPDGRYSNVMSPYVFSDYDSEKEFAVFQHRMRMDLLECIKYATMVAPLVAFAYFQQWLTLKITKGRTNLEYKSDPNDPEYLEWQAVTQGLDVVTSRILMVNEKPSVQSGLQLLELCLEYSPTDPWLLSARLSCISALFVFVSMSTGSMAVHGDAILQRVLVEIFYSLVFHSPGETRDVRSNATKNVRRHAASFLVKIGEKYPLLVLSMFDKIHAIARNLTNEPSQLSRIEKVMLYEALLLISNHFSDYKKQRDFISEVISDASTKFVALGVEAFKGPLELMRFLGLDGSPAEQSIHDVAATNRDDLTYCIASILSVVKRSTIPEDPDRAMRGGFIVGYSENGNPIYSHPAAFHIIPLLPTLFALIRAMNGLFAPSAIAALSEGYKNAHGLVEREKLNLLGVRISNNDNDTENDQSQRSPVTRMQEFLTEMNENCCILLGRCSHVIGREFYEFPRLAQALLESVFSNLGAIPDYKVRPIMRVFLKPFVCTCPPAFYENVLVPILIPVSTHMRDRLTEKWHYITKLRESGKDEESSDVQEVIYDMLNRNLTKDFIDVLKVTLFGGAASDASPSDKMDYDNGGMCVDTPVIRSSNGVVDSVSELGALVLRHPLTYQSVVTCVLRALSWNDSNTSLKATVMTAPIVRTLVANGNLTEEMASGIMMSVLQGLEIHGQHDANEGSLITLGAQVYEILRPRYSTIVEVMRLIPGVNHADLQRFDDKMKVACSKVTKIEKGKKEMFKKMTNQLIGKSIGQLFRKEVKIDNLPRWNVTEESPTVRVDNGSKNVVDTEPTALFIGHS